MAVSPFESAWAAPHLGDAETAALFSDAAEIAAMVRVEAALARVQGRLGVIPAKAGEAIAGALAGVVVDPAALGPGTAGSGIPVPALVKALRKDRSAARRRSTSTGARRRRTSSTRGWCCGSPGSATCSAHRLDAVIAALGEQARAHRDLSMAARTWGQPATPTTFGLRIAGWLAPLLRHRDRLAELRPRLLVVSCGGASGTMAAMGAQGPGGRGGAGRGAGPRRRAETLARRARHASPSSAAGCRSSPARSPRWARTSS